MIYDRYYYSLLSSADKKAYKKIYDGIQNHENKISISKLSGITVPLNEILYFIGLDNPHIFYVDFNHCKLLETSSEKSIKVTYWYTQSEINELNRKVDTVFKKMLSRISGNTDYEKEKSVHDLLIENVLYDTEAATNLPKYFPVSNSILGVLFYKSAVCEGVAKVTKMLLNLLNIKCIVAVGFDLKHNEPHAWNIVKINGQPYHLDVTWDISNATVSYSCYDYFNLDDSYIKADHRIQYRYPVCNSLADNYFEVNHLTVRNKFDINKCLLKSINRKYVSFKYIGSTESDFNNAVTYAINSAGNIAALNGKSSISYIINSTQRICTIYFV